MSSTLSPSYLRPLLFTHYYISHHFWRSFHFLRETFFEIFLVLRSAFQVLALPPSHICGHQTVVSLQGMLCYGDDDDNDDDDDSDDDDDDNDDDDGLPANFHQ